MDVKEERIKAFKDQSSSDSAHARVREAHPEVGEEISKYTKFNLPDRIAFVEEYLANLQETYSVVTETTDSGFWSQSVPSESGLDTKISAPSKSGLYSKMSAPSKSGLDTLVSYKIKLRISAS